MLSRVKIGLDTSLYRKASKEHQAKCSSIESMYQQLKGDIISPSPLQKLQTTKDRITVVLIHFLCSLTVFT